MKSESLRSQDYLSYPRMTTQSQVALQNVRAYESFSSEGHSLGSSSSPPTETYRQRFYTAAKALKNKMQWAIHRRNRSTTTPPSQDPGDHPQEDMPSASVARHSLSSHQAS